MSYLIGPDTTVKRTPVKRRNFLPSASLVVGAILIQGTTFWAGAALDTYWYAAFVPLFWAAMLLLSAPKGQ